MPSQHKRVDGHQDQSLVRMRAQSNDKLRQKKGFTGVYKICPPLQFEGNQIPSFFFFFFLYIHIYYTKYTWRPRLIHNPCLFACVG